MFDSPIRQLMTVTAVTFALSTSAVAQQAFSDAQVRATIDVVLDNIERARCGPAHCAPASVAERRAPPLSLADARRVIARGQLSALAEWCGLDWQRRNYLPLMQAERAAGRPDRVLAMVGLMHGYVHGQAQSSLRQGGACTAADRADTERRLAAR
jgi:hypothetical protein